MLIYLHPTYFAGFSSEEKTKTMVICTINLVAFPLLAVLLLKGLGFIQSIFLHTQKDRIIPYIACGIFFFWAYIVFKNQDLYPKMLSVFVLGIFFASSAALIANIYTKVSMHSIGMGGWLGLCLLLWYNNSMFMGWPLAIVVLLTGIVCTARLFLHAHSSFQVYLGLAIGLLSQVAAHIFVSL